MTPLESLTAKALTDSFALLANADAVGDTSSGRVLFDRPTETLIDGTFLSTAFTMRFRATDFPELANGDAIRITSGAYRRDFIVREVVMLNDGHEGRATLSEVE